MDHPPYRHHQLHHHLLKCLYLISYFLLGVTSNNLLTVDQRQNSQRHPNQLVEYSHTFIEKTYLQNLLYNELCSCSILQGYRFYSENKNSEVINYVGTINYEPVLMTLISKASQEQRSEMLEVDWYERSCSSFDSSIRGSQTMQRKFQELYREALQKNQSISIGTMDLDSFGMSEIYSFSHIFPSFLSPWSVRTYPPPGGNHTTINHTFIFQKSTGYLISEHITYVTHIPTNYPYHTNCDRAIENVESKMNDKMDILHKSPILVNISIEYDLYTRHDPQHWSENIFVHQCPFTNQRDHSNSSYSRFFTTDNDSTLPFTTSSSSSMFFSSENYKMSTVITACIIGLILAYLIAMLSD